MTVLKRCDPSRSRFQSLPDLRDALYHTLEANIETSELMQAVDQPTKSKPRVSTELVAPWVEGGRHRFTHRSSIDVSTVSGHAGGRTAALVAVDLAVVAGSLALANWGAGFVAGASPSWDMPYLTLGLVVTLFVQFFAGLYAPISLSPVVEVRKQALSTTAAFALYTWAASILTDMPAAVAIILGGAWALALFGLPVSRAILRRAVATKRWWRSGVVVIGADETAALAIRYMLEHPERGLHPVAAVAPGEAPVPSIHGIPVVDGLAAALTLGQSDRLGCALVALSDVDDEGLTTLFERYLHGYKHVLMVADVLRMGFLGMPTRALGECTAWHVTRRQLSVWRRWLKRAIDVAVAFTALVLLSPLLLLIAWAIKLDAPGPIFFSQVRLGRGCRCFRLFKFRTMHVGAEERLNQLLLNDESARLEYMRYRKLRKDPRVTRIGQILRQYSLDELPQLINVLLGDMSLVGPRAYLPNELTDMKSKERVITRVLPGITGYWQVMGRNDLEFQTRVDMDLHYLTNWSFSLDLYLLAQTVPAVVFGKGAA